MSRPPPPLLPKRRYKKRGPHTWAAVREAFLAGATAGECAARFDVTEAALFWRARREGWRKVDEAEAHDRRVLREGEATAAAEASAPRAAADADPASLAREALILSAQAMRAGRAAEAQALARLAEIAGRLQARTPKPLAEEAEPPTPTEAELAAEAAARETEMKELFDLIEARAFEYARDMLTGGALRSAGGGLYRPAFVVIDNRVVRTATLDPLPEPVADDDIWRACGRAWPQPPEIAPYRLPS